MGLQLLQQFGGINAIMFYASEIFRSVGKFRVTNTRSICSHHEGGCCSRNSNGLLLYTQHRLHLSERGIAWDWSAPGGDDRCGCRHYGQSWTTLTSHGLYTPCAFSTCWLSHAYLQCPCFAGIPNLCTQLLITRCPPAGWLQVASSSASRFISRLSLISLT